MSGSCKKKTRCVFTCMLMQTLWKALTSLIEFIKKRTWCAVKKKKKKINEISQK